MAALIYKTHRTNDLYEPEPRSALMEACVPAGDARPGDLLGASMAVEVDRAVIRPGKSAWFAVQDDEGAVLRRWDELGLELRDPAARLAMRLMMERPWACQALMIGISRDLDIEGHGESLQLDLLMMPHCALVTVSDYEFAVYEDEDLREADERLQEHCDRSHRLLVEATHSAHHAIAVRPHIEAACRAFGRIAPIPDVQGRGSVSPLAAPRP